MNPFSPFSLLRQHYLRPIKYRGQNFLISKTILKKIVSVAKIKPREQILEVGPGTGNLTQELLNAGAKVIAVEKDKNLAEILKLKNLKLKIITEDILRFNETKIKPPYRLIANIPYYLTGQLIKKFLLSSRKPTAMILMIQKEVAERIVARPPRSNFLSALVQFLAETKIVFRVRKESFWPQPKVDSALIKITPHRRDYNINQEQFIAFLKAVFRQPRQTLWKNLKRANLAPPDKLEKIFGRLNLAKNVRAQNLDVKELQELFGRIKTG